MMTREHIEMIVIFMPMLFLFLAVVNLAAYLYWKQLISIIVGSTFLLISITTSYILIIGKL